MAATKTKTTPVKTQPARFEAPGQGLRIVLEQQKEKFSEGGVKQAVPGTGRTISFEQDGFGGQYVQTDDPDLIAELRRRSEAGTFFEVPIAKPDPSPILKQVIGLTARGDVDALVAIAKEEEDTHGREDVMDAIADALEQIQGG